MFQVDSRTTWRTRIGGDQGGRRFIQIILINTPLLPYSVFYLWLCYVVCACVWILPCSLHVFRNKRAWSVYEGLSCLSTALVWQFIRSPFQNGVLSSGWNKYSDTGNRKRDSLGKAAHGRKYNHHTGSYPRGYVYLPRRAATAARYLVK